MSRSTRQTSSGIAANPVPISERHRHRGSASQVPVAATSSTPCSIASVGWTAFSATICGSTMSFTMPLALRPVSVVHGVTRLIGGHVFRCGPEHDILDPVGLDATFQVQLLVRRATAKPSSGGFVKLRRTRAASPLVIGGEMRKASFLAARRNAHLSHILDHRQVLPVTKMRGESWMASMASAVHWSAQSPPSGCR